MDFYRKLFNVKSLEDISTFDGFVLERGQQELIICYLIHIGANGMLVKELFDSYRSTNSLRVIRAVIMQDNIELFKIFAINPHDYCVQELLIEFSCFNIVTNLLENGINFVRMVPEPPEAMRELFAKYGRIISCTGSHYDEELEYLKPADSLPPELKAKIKNRVRWRSQRNIALHNSHEKVISYIFEDAMRSDSRLRNLLYVATKIGIMTDRNMHIIYDAIKEDGEAIVVFFDVAISLGNLNFLRTIV